jgi:predicted nucleic acid-binding protein
MAVAYLDTSALGRVLLGEPDAGAILAALGRFEERVASRLARVELRRLALRENRLADADALLAGVALLPVTADLLAAAEVVAPATVATLDAIHLVTALQLSAIDRLDALVTYDHQLATGARQHGITVLAPA